ncbi:MAG: LamG domain-containing protein [Candidatus Marsarchaeota archaeon]|nr:LamG domain-containing protein [Candidatus Marsarchaeota archaeon]
MLGQARGRRSKGQIAFEFIIVYSFVLVLFLVLFGLVALQRSTTLNAQQYASMQLVAQDISSYIDQALVAGSGYNATLSMPVASSLQPYNLFITSDGAVIANETVGKTLITAIAYSSARNLLINGTISSAYNGITVYSVPAYTGLLKVANENGVVYIDAQPPNPATYARQLSTEVIAETKAAQFNGQSSVVIPPSPFSNNVMCNVTLAAWSYDSGMVSSGSEGGVVGLYGGGWDDIEYNDGSLRFELRNTSTGNSWGVSQSFKGRWIFTALVLSNGHPTGYINGVDYPGGANYIGCIGLPDMNGIGRWDRYFNGSIANVQIYSTALSQAQVSQLYQEGISGTPISNAGLVGWWPLDGNANDYSGNGNNGVPNYVNYSNVAQVNVHASTGSAADSTNTLIGAAPSFGSLSVTSNTSDLSSVTDPAGNATVFVTSNSPIGMANVTINAFSSANSLQSHLVGWWPLDEGYGSVAHDMSGNGNNGTFVSPSWAPFANTSAFQAAEFNGQGAGTYTGTLGSYINVSSSPVLKPTHLTVGAWVEANSDTPWMFVAGVQATASDGSYYLSMTGNSIGEMTFGTYNSTVAVRTNSTPLQLGKWYYVVGTYNGTNASIFINGKLSGSVPDSQLIYYIPSKLFRIGNLAGFDDWNGIISNVQVYNTSLTAQQIAQQYSAGITAMPLSNTGLVGWWPLDGNANDYSIYANGGTATSVTYSNMQTVSSSLQDIPVANLSNSGYISTGDTNLPTGNSARSVFAWVETPSVPSTFEIIYSYGSTISNEWSSLHLGSGGVVCFSNYGPNYCTTSTLAPKKWYLVGYTYTSGTVTAYIDGVPQTVATGLSLSTTLPASDPADIGKCSDTSCGGTPYYFNGKIAGIQVYNTSLTQQQVQQLYAQGLPLYAKVNVSLS